MALGAIPMGLLVDRYPRVPLFRASLAILVGSLLAGAFASNLPWLVATRVIVGVALAAILVAAYSMVADLYPPTQRGRATMLVGIGEVSGAPAAFALGGALLTMSASIGHGLEHWRWALLWMSVPLAVVFLLILTLREPARTEVRIKNPALRQVMPELWSYRRMIAPLLLARIMVYVADGAVLVWGAPFFQRHFGLAPGRTGALMGAALLISGILGPLLGGPLADWCQRSGGPRRTVGALCGLAMISVLAALFALLPGPYVAVIGLTGFLTLGFTIGVAAIALSNCIIPGELRGLNMALTIVAAALFAIGIAPLAVSTLSGLLGGPQMIGTALAVVCSVTSVIGAIVFGFSRRNFPALQAGAVIG
jgi:MFS family permease